MKDHPDIAEIVTGDDKEPSVNSAWFWKAFAGAVLGVGAVAAAPFTGGGSVFGAITLAESLAGAGAIATAIGAGAVGAGVGGGAVKAGRAYINNVKDKARKEGYVDGIKDGKAEQFIEISKLQQRLEAYLCKLKDSSQSFNAIYAMEAVAVAAANCDGVICTEEREEIDMFILGISQSSLPGSVKRNINNIYDNPLTIKEAFNMAVNSGIDMEIFDEIIGIVISADKEINENEEVFLYMWKGLREFNL